MASQTLLMENAMTDEQREQYNHDDAPEDYNGGDGADD